jgi:abhydrolase domain-containing protein 17
VPCIVYAHGNSSDLGDSLRFITGMTVKFKAEYVAFDYTGYGESRVPSVGEEVICGDVELVLAWLRRPLEEVILWGFSLGTYPVIMCGSRLRVKASVLQCPIGSLSCMFYDEY